jgi:hypothetical protein
VSGARFVTVPGGVEVRLSRQERLMLTRAVEVVDEAEVSGAAAGRLVPSPYEDDAEANAEYQRLVAPDLDRARSADRDAMAEALESWDGRRVIDLAEAESWLRAIGEARIVLAAEEGAFAEGVDDASWEARMTPLALIRRPGLAMLTYLGAIQQDLVEALLETVEQPESAT